MSNHNEDIKKDGGDHKHEKHQSWLGHIVDEVKEKFEELVEEAQNNGGEFSVLGNGHINVVHDHHKHNDDKERTEDSKPKEEQPVVKAEAPKEEKKAEHHQSWLGHIVEEVREKFDELMEEAQNNGGEFSVLGNGKVNVVHDHHKDHAPKEEKENGQEEKK